MVDNIHPPQVVATKLLIKEALTNPLNQRMMLLSDSCVPLQPAPLVYTALMTRGTSAINACSGDDHNIYRYVVTNSILLSTYIVKTCMMLGLACALVP